MKKLFLFFLLLSGLVSAQVTIVTGTSSWSFTGGAYPPPPSNSPYYGAFAMYYITPALADGSYSLTNRVTLANWYILHDGVTKGQDQGNTGTILFSSAPYGVWFLHYSHKYDQSSNIYDQTVYASAFYPVVNQSQTISIAPSTAVSGVKGQSFGFTLSGAQSTNTYSASVVSGNVSLALSGNSLTVFTSQSSGSTGVISVHINSGNGYNASDSVDITLTLGASKKVRFTIPANKGDYTIIYKAYQGGVEIGSITKVAGAGGSIFELDVGADGGEVTLKQFASGLGVDGVSLVNQSGTTSQVGTESKQIPSTDPTISPAAAGDGVVLLNPANNTSKASVWEVPPVNAAPATDSTIRQGFDKLVGTDAQIPTVPDETAAINATDLTITAETAGDSLSTARTGYNSRLSEIQSTKPVLPTVNSEIHRYEIHCLPDSIGPIVLDFSRFETPISIMRAIIKFAIIFMSWFAYAKTLKSSIV